ncbi:hypothetical protein GCM10027440_00100 [Nocardiopsis coralliicola]
MVKLPMSRAAGANVANSEPRISGTIMMPPGKRSMNPKKGERSRAAGAAPEPVAMGFLVGSGVGREGEGIGAGCARSAAGGCRAGFRGVSGYAGYGRGSPGGGRRPAGVLGAACCRVGSGGGLQSGEEGRGAGGGLEEQGLGVAH